MLHKIIIKNFGPISEYSQEINPLTILIGQQASGKSTITKMIFFFRSIRDDLLKYFLSEKSLQNPFFEFNKQLRTKFIGYFGTTTHMKPFDIIYYYSDDKKIDLNLTDDGYVKIHFSDKLKDEILQILRKVEKIKSDTINHQSSFIDSWDTVFWTVHKKKLSDEIKHDINTAFEDHRTSIFIPAGRSLVATLADHLQEIGPRSTDLLLKDFIERINLLKNNFSKSFDEIIKDRKKLSTAKIQFENIKMAIRIINRILKGQYIFSTDGERIYFNENEYTKLMYSSSGQQEVVWIILLLFIIILEQLDVFLVIEEPEAHLYPSAQKDIVELIALVANTSDSHIMITTHSPYILSAFNIYLYAGKLSDKLDEKKSNIVEKRLRIKVCPTAFMIKRQKTNFEYKNIIDQELGLIQAEAIDEASYEINRKLDELMDMEVSE